MAKTWKQLSPEARAALALALQYRIMEAKPMYFNKKELEDQWTKYKASMQNLPINDKLRVVLKAITCK